MARNAILLDSAEMERRALVGLVVGWGSLLTPIVEARADASGMASATMAIGVEVAPNCSVAAQPLAFGAVSAVQAPTRGTTASIEVVCGSPAPFSVSLDDGQNFGEGSRRALDPATGEYVAYEIYVDPAHTQRWGSYESDTVARVAASDGALRLTAYGVIGAAPPAAGRFADLVTVTVSF